jgi:hypothetical protein
MISCCYDSKTSTYPFRRYRDHNHFPDFQKPLVLVKSIPYNRQTGVSPSIKAIKLIFGRDFDNEPGWVNVGMFIDMWQGSNKIPICIKKTVDNCDGHRDILVIPTNKLLGGVTYKVRVKLLLANEHGETVKKTSLIVFTTGCK